MPYDTTAAHRLAAHLVKLRAHAAVLDDEIAALDAQAGALLPDGFDEDSARAELGQAQAVDIANDTETAAEVAAAISDRRAAHLALIAQIKAARATATREAAQRRETRAALAAQIESGQDLLSDELTRAGLARYQDAHATYADAVRALVAAGVEIVAAGALLSKDPHTGGPRIVNRFEMAVTEFEVGRLAGQWPDGVGAIGSMASLSPDSADRLAGARIRELVLEITGQELA
jgi:hypothetical protein